ncbi:MAG: hypothetical protein EAZ69_23695, partial [Oscillatoriales cyanobacterium]
PGIIVEGAGSPRYLKKTINPINPPRHYRGGGGFMNLFVLVEIIGEPAPTRFLDVFYEALPHHK